MKCAGVHRAHLRLPRCGAATRTVRVVHISDTHTDLYEDVPPGDILVHSGDALETGSPDEYAEFTAWLRALPHPVKIIVPGNHECGLDRYDREAIEVMMSGNAPGTRVLIDESIDVLGLNIFGSPWNNSTSSDAAFALNDDERATKWANIPGGIDVLVTHVPPLNVLDLRHKVGKPGEPCSLCDGRSHPDWFHWGCPHLRRVVEEVRPPLHLFGHVHHTTGIKTIGETVFSNAAMKIHRMACIIDVEVPATSDD